MRRRKTNLLEDFRYAFGAPAIGEAMQCERFREHLADRHPRVE
jgi:hypothetical protein